MGGFKALMGPMELSGQLTPLAADFGRQEVHSELLSRLSQLGISGLLRSWPFILYRDGYSGSGYARQIQLHGLRRAWGWFWSADSLSMD